MKINSRACELCNGEATTYCSSDNASLCWTCDAKVHEANFLVARHVRQIICSTCKMFTKDCISGMGFQAISTVCPSCSPVLDTDLDSLSSSSSSARVSTMQSSSCVAAANGGSQNGMVRKKNDGQQTRPWRAIEGIFVNWCMRLGLSSDDTVQTACDMLSICSDQFMVLPLRVSLAASLWFGFRFCRDRSLSTCQTIKRLEEVSGVPAKLISTAESKLQQIFRAGRKKLRQHHDHQHPQLSEESWAES